jgi:glycosyltransferase involved in cell wall biosynthesis
VTTSNPTYRAILGKLGVAARVLPLYGNPPIVEKPATDWLFAEVQRAKPAWKRRGDVWVFAMFGALHPVWPPEPLFTYLHAAAEQQGKSVVIASIGRLSSGEALWERISVKYATHFYFLRLGEQPAARVSEFLHLADFAIATSPWDLIGKSASATAMLEHGLPVIVNRTGSRFNEEGGIDGGDPLLVKMDAQLPARLASLQKRPPQSGLSGITQEFVRLLQTTPSLAP